MCVCVCVYFCVFVFKFNVNVNRESFQMDKFPHVSAPKSLCISLVFRANYSLHSALPFFITHKTF